MLVNKGVLTCKLTFSWAVLCIGYLLMSTVNAAGPAVPPKGKEKQDGSDANIIRSRAKSLEDCAETCAKEKKIDCNFFKYHKSSQTCMMSSSDQPQMQRLNDGQKSQGKSPQGNNGGMSQLNDGQKSQGKSPQGNNGEDKVDGKSISHWITELNSKMEELEDQESDIEKMKSAIGDIRDDLKVLRKTRLSDAHHARSTKEAQEQAFGQMSRKMVGMKVDGEKFKSAVHALSNMQRVLGKGIGGLKEEQKDMTLKMSELEKSDSDLTAMVSSLKATDTAVLQDMDSVKDSTNSLTAAFNRLQNRLNRELANKQMSPAMVKLKHNQGTLATALESVMDKVTNLVAQLPYLEKQLQGTNQKLSDQTVGQQGLQSKIKMLLKDLIEVKKSVRDILDPRSEININRAKSMLKFKTDISILKEMDRGLKNDLGNQRDDLAHVIKDVSNLDVLSQHLRDKLNLALSASKKFHQDILDIKQKQKDALSVVEVAQMQKQVLKALNRLKTREAILLKQLSLYRGAVKTLGGKVEKTSKIKDRTQQVVSTLQSRLSHFEKEIQLLFDRANALTEKFKKPQPVKGLDKLVRAQTQTFNQISDLVQQVQNLKNRVTVLSVDLQETKWEAEEEKKQMAKDIIERQEEMEKRENEMKKKVIKDKKEEERALALRKKQMEKEQKVEKEHFEQEVQMEKRKRVMEEQKNQELAEEMDKKKRQSEEREKMILAAELVKRKKDMEQKLKQDSAPIKKKKKKTKKKKENIELKIIEKKGNVKETTNKLKKFVDRRKKMGSHRGKPRRKKKGSHQGKPRGKEGKTIAHRTKTQIHKVVHGKGHGAHKKQGHGGKTKINEVLTKTHVRNH